MHLDSTSPIFEIKLNILYSLGEPSWLIICNIVLWELLLVYIESIEIGYLIGISNKLKLKLIKGLKKKKKKSNMSQLLATQLVMMEKDKEILKLKAELARQQNSIQQTSGQNLTKQQKEFQEQIEQMIVQKEAERSALKSQIQQLRTRFLQKYYPNMYTKGSPVFPNTTDQTPIVHNTMKQTSTTGTMTIQTQTEDQDTQDNTPPTPSDTTRHPMAYPDTKPDFEQDPELDSKDQNILAIETTDTLDNSIDNSNPTFDNLHNGSISDYTDIKQTVDNSDIGDPNESKTETTDDKIQDQTDNIDNEDQDNLNLNPKKLFRLTTIPKIAQLTSMTIIVQWKPKLKLTIVTKSLNQLKVKMKVTLNPLDLKALTLILTLMLAQSMTLKILKP